MSPVLDSTTVCMVMKIYGVVYAAVSFKASVGQLSAGQRRPNKCENVFSPTRHQPGPDMQDGDDVSWDGL